MMVPKRLLLAACSVPLATCFRLLPLATCSWLPPLAACCRVAHSAPRALLQQQQLRLPPPPSLPSPPVVVVIVVALPDAPPHSRSLAACDQSPMTVSVLPQIEGPGCGHAALLADGADDPRDPLSLLERAETLGREAVAASISNDATRSSGDQAVTPLASASGEASQDLVGRAALLNVRQCYQLVEHVSHQSSSSCSSSHVDGGGAGSALALAKRREVLRLLDTLSFHQAIIFSNRPETAAELVESLNSAGDDHGLKT